ncbi:L-carnitine dehydratase/bile acid-inducible protein F [Acidisarcina polymorpha]|uniref:L-carnitine dehydratase/bile acid-inducible protein F n=1 Tax=Acidisarcina polymorpha TaxID=2211140 RepID=A0A2Z5FYJ8_9BACT|nr:CoA transferase [Acidisarcina polymorpha]AXC11594.1 L-carnitine dehydratase/bile acid-inducible protein F [Acidisarcina polymorpha]
MPPVLESMRVVEITEALAGPYCAMLLGDFGADVIKVERRITGDHARGWGPPFAAGESAYFLAANRNKRSLTLDYDHPAGREVLERLIATADVLLINQPSLASLRRRALDPETLLKQYSRLIYCAISGYGLGPSVKTGQPGYDIVAQAEAGVMSFTGEPQGEPVRYPVAIADMTCGAYAAMGILAALLARERSGQGQFLDMALFDSQLTWLINIGSNWLNCGKEPVRWGNAHPSIVPYEVFAGSDGRNFVLGVGTEPLWLKLTNLLGEETGWADEPRFATNAQRIEHRAELIPMLRERFRRRPAAIWLEKLALAKIPAAAIQSVPEALGQAQSVERSMIVEIEHPLLGIARSVGNPVRLSQSPPTYRLPPPLLGEHTAAILGELRYDENEVAELRRSAAV